MCVLLTKTELAARFKARPSTVAAWVRAGKVPAIRVSAKVVRFDLDEVVQAIRQRAAGVPDAE